MNLSVVTVYKGELCIEPLLAQFRKVLPVFIPPYEIILMDDGSLPGLPFLVSIMALFSMAQLFAFGIFGEYRARMFDQRMDRRPYAIHKVVEK